MALVVNDRVKETSTTTGTGTFTLDGAVTGFETFSSAIGNSNTTYYAIEIPNSTEFEVGLGTVSAGQLARTEIISSSNSDSAVDFSAGTKIVFCTLPASKFVPGKFEGSNFTNSILIGNATTGTLNSATGNTGVGVVALDAITSGDSNVAVGHSSGSELTSGSQNVFIGANAGELATDPLGNVAIGQNALGDADPGNNNIAIGESAGKLITGVRNLVIGENAGDNITSGSGNVIIGSAVDPSSATDNRQLIIAGNDGSTTTTWISGDNSGNLTFPADLTVDTDTLYVDSTNDRIGIGTSSPTRKLTIAGGSNAKIQFKDGGVQSLYFGDSGTDFAGYLHYDHNNDQFRINTLSSTVLTGGSVGIGTTSPSAQLHITGSDTSDQVIFENTDAGTGTAPDLVFYRNSASPAVNDLLGRIDFRGKNDGGTSIDYGFIYGVIEDETAGTEDGALWFNLEKNGSVIQPLKLKSNENVFNDNGEDINFRIESNNDANIFFVDAGNDRIGIGTSSPTYTLESLGSGTDGAFAVFHNQGSGGVYSGVQIASANQLGGGNSDTNLTITRWNGVGTKVAAVKLGVEANNNDGVLTFSTAENADFNSSTYTERMRIDGDTGNVGIGTSSPSTLLHLSSADPQITITDTDGTGSQVIKAVGDDLVLDSPNDVTIDAAAEINLDTDNSSVRLKDGGTEYGRIHQISGGGLVLKSQQSDKDLRLEGVDGGSSIVALSLDMSEAGAATFNDKVILGVNKRLELGDAGEYIYGDGTNLQFVSSNAVGFDAANSITLDGGSGGTILKAGGGTTYGSLINSSGDLIIKSGTTTALTFSGANATLAGNLDVSSGTIKLDGNYPTGTNNVALGNTALDSIGTGGAGHNVAIGHAALTADDTGTGNVGIGAFALTSTVTGNYSTAIGQEALKVNTASWNNAIGFQSMLTSVGGEKNIAMGFWSLKNLGSNDKNVAIGHEAGINLTGGDNNIIIGHNAQAASATTSNQITLGDANITSLRIPGLASGASSGDVLTYDGTDITLSAPTGVSAGFAVAMAIAL